jgi:hypothetical protein
VARKTAGLIAGALLAVLAFAAGAQPTSAPRPVDPRYAERLKTPQTPFQALAPDERRVLAPVEERWATMPGYQQQRLVNSARRYQSLQPIQKERFDSRIKDWAAMTPEQRRAARETFDGLRRLPPARQHELRERWLQQHRPAEGALDPHPERQQVEQRPQAGPQPIPEHRQPRSYDRSSRQVPGDPSAQRR